MNVQQIIYHRPRVLNRTLIAFALGVFLFIILNPVTSLDVVVFVLFLLVLGHITLREKLLLVFLILRPALDYWRDVTIFSYRGVTVNVTAAMALLLLAWSLGALYRYRRRLLSAPLVIASLLFIVWSAFSISWSAAPGTTLIEVIKFLTLFLLFTVSYFFAKDGRLSKKQLLGAFALSAIIPLAAALFQFATGTGLTTFDVRGRVYGTLGHPNVLAFFLLSLFILHTHYSAIEPISWWKKNPHWRVAVYALLLTLLFLTYTRAALVGLVIFLFIIGLMRFRFLAVRLAIGLALFFTLFFPLNAVLLEYANVDLRSLPIIGRITSRNEDADSLAWRQSLLRETAPIISARRWQGYGLGTFPEVWQNNRSLAHQFDDSAEAHNDYLRLTMELGVIGLALYLLLLGILIRHALHPRPNITVLAWIIVFAVMSLSDNMLRHTPVMWLTWAYWGAALGWREHRAHVLNFLRG